MAVYVEAIGGNCPGGSVRVGFYSRRDLSGRELFGGELNLWGSCPGRNCPGGIHLEPPRALSLRIANNADYLFNL